jgi:hypothetical protein
MVEHASGLALQNVEPAASEFAGSDLGNNTPKRRLRAGIGLMACATVLAVTGCSANKASDSSEIIYEPSADAAAPQVFGSDTPRFESSESAAPLPAYTGVQIHYARIDGTDAVDARTKRATAEDVRGALRILDDGFRGTFALSGLPAGSDPEVHDLRGQGIEVTADCGEPASDEMDIVELGDTIVEAVDARSKVHDEILDVVVVNAPADTCSDIPVGLATGNDYIIFRPDSSNEYIAAHEINHNFNYGHDAAYAAKLVNNVVTVDNSVPVEEYGNYQTLAGDGPRALTEDKDPLTGYELVAKGVMQPQEIVTVGDNQTKQLTLAELSADNTKPKVVQMQLEAQDSLIDAKGVMLELSSEYGDNTTLKAYVTDRAPYVGIDGLCDKTVSLPLGGEYGGQLGLGEEREGQQVTLKVGDESIKVTLDKLTKGPTASAKITVQRD